MTRHTIPPNGLLVAELRRSPGSRNNFRCRPKADILRFLITLLAALIALRITWVIYFANENILET